MTVPRGRGTFALELGLEQHGHPHLTFYAEDGHPIGGLYFGLDEWLLPDKGWSHFTPVPEHTLPDLTQNPIQLL